MLDRFIPKFIQELELGDASLSAGVPGSYVIPLDEGLSVTLTDIPNGFIIKSNIATFPTAKQEAFATDAMLANLFGQGTCGSILGLTPDGGTLTLTRVVDYPIDYKEFRGLIEDFINMVDFWREEAAITAN